MPMIHQKLDAVILGRDGVMLVERDQLDNLKVKHIELESAGRTFVGTNFSGHAHGRFLRQVSDALKNLRRDGLFEDDALNNSGPVAKKGEKQFSTFAKVVDPTLDLTSGSLLATLDFDTGGGVVSS
jgi:hypothetical protein